MTGAAAISRAEFDGLPRLPLRRPTNWKPAVWRVETSDGPVVVKDVRHCRGFFERRFARWLLGRERRVLERLGVLAGTPRLLGSIDADAMVLSFVPGRALDAELFRRRPRDLLAQLRSLTDQLHARGIYHLDLHQRKNLLVDDDGRLHVIDFGAAVVPGRVAKALLGRLFRAIDHQAGFKFLARFTPDELTVDEARMVLRQRSLRRLWPFKTVSQSASLAARRRLQQ